MSLKVVSTKNAPAAIGEPQTPGPYSQAIIANGFVYTAGQIAFDPDTMKIVGKDVVEQTTQTLKNLRAILEAAGTSLQKVVKTTVFLQDMNDFGRMNEVYQEFFAGNEFPPARSAVEVARLPRDVFVEIECVALAA